ncbi:Ribosome biogenesis protein NSA2 [Zea mays]|uniref:Ribosome biogenesis protein NSA2 n=1 Tax=Zea mays TaxID=4577 RepID=A0A3L6FDY2_MAIZE|nr:Ribosome biogenesis protein NSA2 [Zea mays]
MARTPSTSLLLSHSHQEEGRGKAGKKVIQRCLMLLPTRELARQPQGDHIELHQKRHGKHLDHKVRKHEARELIGTKGKRFVKKRHAEKAQMKKT